MRWRTDGGSVLNLWTWIILSILIIHKTSAAPVTDGDDEGQTQLQESDTGCYYNLQHYDEGDRIITNEPCLNCTCHNRMLMCYLRVCPFTKPIGQDCTVEKRADLCCPIITCPEVPVQLLTSTTENAQSPNGEGQQQTSIGHIDNFGCHIDGEFYSDGAQLPSDPSNPCELCYCIRNQTVCLMQECTLRVESCKPVYRAGVCCPVRYACDEIDESKVTTTTTTEAPTTPGLILSSPAGGPLDCKHNGQTYADGSRIETEAACEHCYCMRGEIVCAVQECGGLMENRNCKPAPPLPGACCPETYHCDNCTEVDDNSPYRQDRKHKAENVTTEEIPNTTETEVQAIVSEIYPRPDKPLHVNEIPTDDNKEHTPVTDETLPIETGEGQKVQHPEEATPSPPTAEMGSILSDTNLTSESHVTNGEHSESVTEGSPQSETTAIGPEEHFSTEKTSLDHSSAAPETSNAEKELSKRPEESSSERGPVEIDTESSETERMPSLSTGSEGTTEQGSLHGNAEEGASYSTETGSTEQSPSSGNEGSEESSTEQGSITEQVPTTGSAAIASETSNVEQGPSDFSSASSTEQSPLSESKGPDDTSTLKESTESTGVDESSTEQGATSGSSGNEYDNNQQSSAVTETSGEKQSQEISTEPSKTDLSISNDITAPTGGSTEEGPSSSSAEAEEASTELSSSSATEASNLEQELPSGTGSVESGIAEEGTPANLGSSTEQALFNGNEAHSTEKGTPGGSEVTEGSSPDEVPATVLSVTEQGLPSENSDGEGSVTELGLTSEGTVETESSDNEQHLSSEDAITETMSAEGNIVETETSSIDKGESSGIYASNTEPGLLSGSALTEESSTAHGVSDESAGTESSSTESTSNVEGGEDNQQVVSSESYVTETSNVEQSTSAGGASGESAATELSSTEHGASIGSTGSAFSSTEPSLATENEGINSGHETISENSVTSASSTEHASSLGGNTESPDENAQSGVTEFGSTQEAGSSESSYPVTEQSTAVETSSTKQGGNLESDVSETETNTPGGFEAGITEESTSPVSYVPEGSSTEKIVGEGSSGGDASSTEPGAMVEGETSGTEPSLGSGSQTGSTEPSPSAEEEVSSTEITGSPESEGASSASSESQASTENTLQGGEASSSEPNASTENEASTTEQGASSGGPGIVVANTETSTSSDTEEQSTLLPTAEQEPVKEADEMAAVNLITGASQSTEPSEKGGEIQVTEPSVNKLESSTHHPLSTSEASMESAATSLGTDSESSDGSSVFNNNQFVTTPKQDDETFMITEGLVYPQSSLESDSHQLDGQSTISTLLSSELTTGTSTQKTSEVHHDETGSTAEEGQSTVHPGIPEKSPGENELYDHPVEVTGSTLGEQSADETSEANTSASSSSVSTEESNSVPVTEAITEAPMFGIVPGEGSCLVDKVSYRNNSEIPPASPCQTSCRCVSSIVHCILVSCPAAPEDEKCSPTVKEGACCPTYVCGSTAPIESQSTEKTGSESFSPEPTEMNEYPTDKVPEPSMNEIEQDSLTPKQPPTHETVHSVSLPEVNVSSTTEASLSNELVDKVSEISEAFSSTVGEPHSSDNEIEQEHTEKTTTPEGAAPPESTEISSTDAVISPSSLGGTDVPSAGGLAGAALEDTELTTSSDISAADSETTNETPLHSSTIGLAPGVIKGDSSSVTELPTAIESSSEGSKPNDESSSQSSTEKLGTDYETSSEQGTSTESSPADSESSSDANTSSEIEASSPSTILQGSSVGSELYTELNSISEGLSTTSESSLPVVTGVSAETTATLGPLQSSINEESSSTNEVPIAEGPSTTKEDGSKLGSESVTEAMSPSLSGETTVSSLAHQTIVNEVSPEAESSTDMLTSDNESSNATGNESEVSQIGSESSTESSTEADAGSEGSISTSVISFGDNLSSDSHQTTVGEEPAEVESSTESLQTGSESSTKVDTANEESDIGTGTTFPPDSYQTSKPTDLSSTVSELSTEKSSIGPEQSVNPESSEEPLSSSQPIFTEASSSGAEAMTEQGIMLEGSGISTNLPFISDSHQTTLNQVSTEGEKSGPSTEVLEQSSGIEGLSSESPFQPESESPLQSTELRPESSSTAPGSDETPAQAETSSEESSIGTELPTGHESATEGGTTLSAGDEPSSTLAPQQINVEGSDVETTAEAVSNTTGSQTEEPLSPSETNTTESSTERLEPSKSTSEQSSATGSHGVLEAENSVTEHESDIGTEAQTDIVPEILTSEETTESTNEAEITSGTDVESPALTSSQQTESPTEMEASTERVMASEGSSSGTESSDQTSHGSESSTDESETGSEPSEKPDYSTDESVIASEHSTESGFGSSSPDLGSEPYSTEPGVLAESSSTPSTQQTIVEELSTEKESNAETGASSAGSNSETSGELELNQPTTELSSIAEQSSTVKDSSLEEDSNVLESSSTSEPHQMLITELATELGGLEGSSSEKAPAEEPSSASEASASESSTENYEQPIESPQPITSSEQSGDSVTENHALIESDNAISQESRPVSEVPLEEGVHNPTETSTESLEGNVPDESPQSSTEHEIPTGGEGMSVTIAESQETIQAEHVTEGGGVMIEESSIATTEAHDAIVTTSNHGLSLEQSQGSTEKFSVTERPTSTSMTPSTTSQTTEKFPERVEIPSESPAGAKPEDGYDYQKPINPLAEKPQKPQKPLKPQKPVEPDDVVEPNEYDATDEDYDAENDTPYGPGTCRYAGKVYVSAQQIPRDDPCDFCFCFRSDIICLQQSCPPPIPGCHEEPISGFCCPRYECHVRMATMLNVTSTTTTTTTTLPPHFMAHHYRGAALKTGCMVQGKAYRVGEPINSASGPCMDCICGGDGRMKCEPKVCSPEPMIRKMLKNNR